MNIYVGVRYSSLRMIVGAFKGRVGEYTFLEIWIYAANNLGGRMLLLDISCQQMGDECSFRSPIRVGDTFVKILICVGNSDNSQPRNNDTPLFVIWNKFILEQVFLA